MVSAVSRVGPVIGSISSERKERPPLESASRNNISGGYQHLQFRQKVFEKFWPPVCRDIKELEDVNFYRDEQMVNCRRNRVKTGRTCFRVKQVGTAGGPFVSITD